MKYKGSRFEYREERDADLLRAYRKCIAMKKNIRLAEIAKDIATSQSVRFWVSEQRAYIIVKQMLQHKPLTEMIPQKQRMYKEIYRRVSHYMRTNPSLPLKDIVFHVCNEPAPEFYLTEKSVIVILYRIRKEDECRRRELIRKRSLFLFSQR